MDGSSTQEWITTSDLVSRYGGADRLSTKAKLAEELRLLGEVLVRARERAGLKESDVAARLGLPASDLSKVENVTRRLDVIDLHRLGDLDQLDDVEAMEVDAAQLLREVQKALRGR